MQVVLVMFRSDGERRSFSVTRDVTVIGRREDCDLRIPLSEVSRKHCRFIKDGDSIRIEDLGSSNGTYHNGQRVQEAILSPGDTIQIGPVLFCIQIDGYPAEEEMAPIYQSAEGVETEHSGDMNAEVTGDEILSADNAEEEFETLEEEPAALEEEPVALEEEQLETLDEEPAALEEEAVALEEEPLETLEEEPAAEAEEELTALEEEPLEAIEEEPLAVEEPAPTPAARPSAPPPLPTASADDEALALEEQPAEEELTFEEEPVALEDETISLEEEPVAEISLEDNVVEDFEIIEEDTEEEVDSKHKK